MPFEMTKIDWVAARRRREVEHFYCGRRWRELSSLQMLRVAAQADLRFQLSAVAVMRRFLAAQSVVGTIIDKEA